MYLHNLALQCFIVFGVAGETWNSWVSCRSTLLGIFTVRTLTLMPSHSRMHMPTGGHDWACYCSCTSTQADMVSSVMFGMSRMV